MKDDERVDLGVTDLWVTARVVPGEDQPLLEVEGYLEVWSSISGRSLSEICCTFLPS